MQMFDADSREQKEEKKKEDQNQLLKGAKDRRAPFHLFHTHMLMSMHP